MKQIGLKAPLFVKKPKLTKRQKFLQEMEQVVPWALCASRIAPHYPKKAGGGRQPFPLETMLRIHLMQQWFGYSDRATEETLHDVPMLRAFAGLDAGEDATLIDAPPQTQNRERDAEMSSTKKGNQYHFGLKAHIGVDSGVVHTVEITTAKVADGVMTDAVLYGDEEVVLGDRANATMVRASWAPLRRKSVAPICRKVTQV